MAKAQLTVEIDEDLLDRAREAGIEPAIAAAAGFHLALARASTDTPMGLVENAALSKADPEGAEQRAAQWAEENAEAIKEHNQRIAERGLIGAHWRKW